MPRLLVPASIVLAGLCLVTSPAMSQEPYRQPPPDIVKILDAPPTPGVSLNPQRDLMVLIERESMPPVSELAKPMLRLAGERINPQTNGPFTLARNTGLTLKSVADGRETRIDLSGAANGSIGMPNWTTDGRRFAFTVTRDKGIELWVCDAMIGKARKLTEPILNATMGGAFDWLPDDQRLIAHLVPDKRGPEPKASAVPTGPVVQQSNATAKAPVRTYQDLLESPHDEALFDYYFTSQLAIIDSREGGKVTKIGSSAVYDTVSVSPSGKMMVVSHLIRPYSYLVPASLFPEVVELWDDSGKVIREITRTPLRDTIPIEGVQTGPRSFAWQSNAEDDILWWAEALDNGDPKNKVSHRDRVMRLAAPFTGDAKEILKTEHRYSGMGWFATPNLATVGEYDRDKRWRRTWMYDLAKIGEAKYQPRLLWDLSVNDRYKDPGRPITTLNKRGRNVILVHDNAIYLAGGGASQKGDQPFLDRLDLSTLKTQRLWQCKGETYESVVDVLDDGASRILTNFQSTKEPPNYFARDLAGAGKADRQLTNFPDPAPQLQGIHKELVTYNRDDGVQLSATLYLPPNYKMGSGEKLPLIVWAYPREFNDPSTAGQVTGSPYTFTRLSGISHLFLLLQGYAIMDGATMPVVGDPETMNDTFIAQIVAAAKACIDKAASMGVADPDRVGVGGHSYGAFMTANLLAHSDLFRAGCARSGAYNRTLTPFGFQSERRTLWEAPKSYTELSPFMYADKINEPLLMIHGELDNNPGTFPIQSERLYQAIKGNGGTARLVILPYEAHGYAARENVMQTLAEMIDWFDKYVKNAPPRVPASIGGAGQSGSRN